MEAGLAAIRAPGFIEKSRSSISGGQPSMLYRTEIEEDPEIP